MPGELCATLCAPALPSLHGVAPGPALHTQQPLAQDDFPGAVQGRVLLTQCCALGQFIPLASGFTLPWLLAEGFTEQGAGFRSCYYNLTFKNYYYYYFQGNRDSRSYLLCDFSHPEVLT